MNIKNIAHQIHENAKDKGFYENPPSVGERIALIHSEVSEALEADRNGKYAKQQLGDSDIKELAEIENNMIFKNFFEKKVKDTFEDELADTIIRIFDLCGYLGIDIESHILAKHRFNQTREYKHGKKY